MIFPILGRSVAIIWKRTVSSPPATSNLWQRLSQGRWPRRVVPGGMVIALVILAKLMGLFQVLEWKVLDSFLRWRPAEPLDERILIVGITDDDIQQTGTYPIPDGTFAELLRILAAGEPRAIGLDIYRDIPVEPGHAALVKTFKTTPEIVGIEKISAPPILPPPALPPAQVGFVDLPLDQDGFVRRAYLGNWTAASHPTPETFRFSFALALAKAYLAEDELRLQNGRRHPDNMRFGEAELPRFTPQTGGYVGAEPGGVQMLINPRSGRTPFVTVSMTEVLEGQVPADLIRDRVVLIGLTAISVKDLVNSAAVNSDNPSLFYGVEMHAHITSQILSAVLDGRSLLRGWASGWEILWIVLWGGVAMLLVSVVSQPTRYIVLAVLIGGGIVGISTALLWGWGWWIPIVPTLVAFAVNGLVLPGFYLYDQTLRSRIEERQQVIEGTYDAIHNGPLQSLAVLLRQQDKLHPEVATQLENLNRDLRQVYHRLQQESLPQEQLLQLGTQHVVDLRNPLHEVLYEVYQETLTRDFPGFDSIRFQIVDFKPFQTQSLSLEERRSLCRFLEEALCNVGKHAVGAKRLKVQCLATETANLIRVEDNGQGHGAVGAIADPSSDRQSPSGGRGTQQARAIAQRLRGKFQREVSAKGTYCELRWPLRRSRRWWPR